jgi:hypothetical protein
MALDDKDATSKNEEEKKKDWQNPASWVNFVKSLLFYFVVTLVMGLIGSNFIWLTQQGSRLEDMLPDLEDDPFYTAKHLDLTVSQGYDSESCEYNDNGLTTKIRADNFPYNLKKGINGDVPDDIKFGERIGSWFGWTTEGTFITNRGLIKSWIKNFPPDSPLGNEIFIIYIVAPLTMFFSFLAGFTGFGVACSSAFKSDATLSVLGMFMFYYWFICMVLGAVIFIRLIALLVLYPVANGWKRVSNIFRCNAMPLAVLFGFFAVGAAYDTLDSTVSGAMGVVYVIFVLIAAVQKVNSSI